MSTLIIDQGDDEVVDMTVTAGAGGPADLQGWSLNFYVKRAKTDADADALLHKTNDVDGGIEVQAPASAGLASITIEQEDTDPLDPTDTGRQLHFILKGVDSNGKRVTLAKGHIVIKPDLVLSD